MTTFILAVIIIFLALALMAIGWLITGRSKLQPGACGRDPTKKRKDGECGPSTSCQLCEKPDDKSCKDDMDCKDD